LIEKNGVSHNIDECMNVVYLFITCMNECSFIL
jgi:hypothetical protein